jgi:hypothetical protein
MGMKVASPIVVTPLVSECDDDLIDNYLAVGSQHPLAQEDCNWEDLLGPCPAIELMS